MKRLTLLLAAGIPVVAAGWYLFRPELLFVDKTVNEALPVAAVVTGTGAGPMTLASGSFYGVAHDTMGTASVVELPDGKRVVRLTNFTTSNGPDVRVLLATAADPMDSDAVKAGTTLELGALKGNVGDQNYDVPAGTDLAQFKSVVIWCNRFGVNFGTAPLTGGAMDMPAAPRTLASGAFHGVAHETKGTASVVELPGGKRILRLANFETSNGPDVRVLLATAADAMDDDAVKAGKTLELGKLKGNVGDQNYDVPAGTDLAQYKSVVIWCNRFGVNFATAPLATETDRG
jgi:hypothetical protein